MAEWSSPDDKIFKKVLVKGIGALKPYEESIVKLNILDCPETLSSFNNKDLVVGDNDGDLGRAMDICICTMHLNEKAEIAITLDLEEVTAIIELVEFNFHGFIFEWDAKRKMDIALKHKEKGADFFNNQNQIEAAHRFTKALKILSSIPIDVENPFNPVDNVKITDLQALKEKLYNNLSSCYFRENIYDLVVALCEKVLAVEPNNIKALYKAGVAYKVDRNFEKAEVALSKVMELEPQNKACAHHLAEVKLHLKEASARVNDMMRKMIVGSSSK